MELTHDDLLTDIEMIKLAIELEEDCEVKERLVIELADAEENLQGEQYEKRKN